MLEAPATDFVAFSLDLETFFLFDVRFLFKIHLMNFLAELTNFIKSVSFTLFNPISFIVDPLTHFLILLLDFSDSTIELCIFHLY